MSEQAYAERAISALQAAGWTMTRASNGEETITPASVTLAVEHVMACELGSISMTHPEHGSATFGLLFQNGTPEEVLYDYSYRDDSAGVAIDRVLDSLNEPSLHHT